MLQHKQDIPEEVASRPHRYDEVAKKYIPVPYPEPILYPKWLFKDGKQKLAKSEKDEKKMLAASWNSFPPPIPGDNPNAEEEEEAETDENLVPASSAPSEYPRTLYLGKRTREVNDEKEMKELINRGWSKQPKKNVA